MMTMLLFFHGWVEVLYLRLMEFLGAILVLCLVLYLLYETLSYWGLIHIVTH